MNWNPSEGLQGSSFPCTLSRLIAAKEAENPALLPDLGTASDLVLASDYAGDHDQSAFNVLAFLLADREEVLGEWDSLRSDVRRRFLADGRRLAFKRLSDQLQQVALKPFLQAADRIRGLLFCIAIDKRLQKLMEVQWEPTDGPSDPTLGYKPKVFEKMLRIATIGGTLVGGLGRGGQNLHWISDDDEVVANDELSNAAHDLFCNFLMLLGPKGFRGFKQGIASKFDDERRAEDLVSIPDLVAGATAEHLTAIGPDNFPTESSLIVPHLNRVSTKCTLINAWMPFVTNLKKVLVMARPAGEGLLRLSIADPYVSAGIPESEFSLWVPPDKGWKRSIRRSLER